MGAEINKGKIKNSNGRLTAHICMIFLVLLWGFDYVPAKWALELLSPSCLMFFRFSLGAAFVILAKVITGNRSIVRKKDIPIFILCSLFGQIGYFECEYNAMNMMPVATLTIVLAFLPALSIVLERLIYKRKANRNIYIGILISLIGITLVVGADFGALMQGRGLGYILAVLAIFAWNMYNFITAGLEGYDSLTLSANQMVCSTLILIPAAIHSMPAAAEFTAPVIFGILWIGIIDSGIGYVILVYGLQKLGPTTNAVYSNFLPVTTAIFGVIFLGEMITWLQGIGGAIVIVAGFFVIKEKGRLDQLRESAKADE